MEWLAYVVVNVPGRDDDIFDVVQTTTSLVATVAAIFEKKKTNLKLRFAILF